MTTPAAAKTVVLTGVSRGLGEAMALALLARGCRVIGVGRASSPRLAHAAFTFVACDLARPDAIEATLPPLFDRLAAEAPDFVALVNNAAVVEPFGTLARQEGAAMAAALAVNLVAPTLLCAQFCARFSGRSGDRRIVNVSSGSAENPMPGGAHYCVAKAGLEMLTRSLAAEQGPQGIVAVSLRPGIIDTRMQTRAREQDAAVLPAVGMFVAFHADGQLVAPDTAAGRIVDHIVLGPLEQGRMYRYADLGK